MKLQWVAHWDVHEANTVEKAGLPVRDLCYFLGVKLKYWSTHIVIFPLPGVVRGISVVGRKRKLSLS